MLLVHVRIEEWRERVWESSKGRRPPNADVCELYELCHVFINYVTYLSFLMSITFCGLALDEFIDKVNRD